MSFLKLIARYVLYFLLLVIAVVGGLIYWEDHTVVEIKLDAKYDKQEELNQLSQKAKETGLNKEERARLEFLMQEQKQYMEKKLQEN